MASMPQLSPVLLVLIKSPKPINTNSIAAVGRAGVSASAGTVVREGVAITVGPSGECLLALHRDIASMSSSTRVTSPASRRGRRCHVIGSNDIAQDTNISLGRTANVVSNSGVNARG